MTVTITHPGARLLARPLELLSDVVAGDWAAVASLCATRLKDPAACAADLDELAGRAGVTATRRHPYRYQVWHQTLLVDEPASVVAAALDLYTDLMLGRWDSLERVAPPGTRPAPDWRAVELLDARVRHQRPGTWSEHPYASDNLVLAPPTARLAHHALTELEGGAPCRYDVPAGSPAVHVG